VLGLHGLALGVRGAVGQGLLLQELGSGGMGAVWRAYDPELDRAVALKVLWPGDESEETRQRLLAEAQCLARVDHPNVVSVFDVGRAGDELFVAMELVKGRTLRRWLEEERPKPAAILEAYRQAGAGLGAAHLAGLVHRDFKPENALVDEHGRVRVLDFGLARPAQLGESIPAGTPRYMAPEQRRGRAVDHRSDQFSFCVALAEALGSAAPARIASALRRGQSAAPGDRYPSMHALLRALDPRPAWRRLAWVGAALLLLAGLGAALQARRLVPCSGAGAELERVWPKPLMSAGSLSSGGGSLSGGGLGRSARQRRVAAALPGEFGPVLRSLDEAARAFESGFQRTCAAYRRGEISGELLDRRMACLGDSLAQLDAAVTLLEKPTGRAAAIVEALPKPEDCERARRVETDLPAPKAREVAAIRRELAALRPSGLIDDVGARERAAALRERARRTGHVPLAADVRLVEALLVPEPGPRERALLEAIAAAELAGSDAARAEALLLLAAGQSGDERARTLQLAQAALQRAGPDARLERLLESERGAPAAK
jgi:predicted Ser/Thr protein kinase